MNDFKFLITIFLMNSLNLYAPVEEARNLGYYLRKLNLPDEKVCVRETKRERKFYAPVKDARNLGYYLRELSLPHEKFFARKIKINTKFNQEFYMQVDNKKFR